MSENKIERFLYLFKELEKEVIALSDIKSDDYVPFSRALNKIYYDKSNPLLSDYDNYSYLRSASDLRNLLSHENDTCIPTNEFIQKGERLLSRLKHPVTVYDISTKEIEYCTMDEKVFSIMKKMNLLGLSHFPILNQEKKVIGVFSRSSIFDGILQGIRFDSSSLVSDFEKVTGLSSHLNESFLFVSKTTTAEKVFTFLENRSAHKKNIACLFVTQNGSKDEKLIGICTLADLAKAKQ